MLYWAKRIDPFFTRYDCVWKRSVHLYVLGAQWGSLYALKGVGTQRPKKSELSRWQLSTRKNFPDKVRKSFSRQKKACKLFLRQKSVCKSFLQQNKCAQIIFATKKCVLIVFATKKWFKKDPALYFQRLRSGRTIKFFFQIIKKFQDSLEKFRIVRIVSGWSGKFLVSLKNDLCTLFFPNTINTHFFVAKII